MHAKRNNRKDLLNLVSNPQLIKRIYAALGCLATIIFRLQLLKKVAVLYYCV